jgi:hypothetical protein
VALSASRRPEVQEIGRGCEPTVAFGEGHDPGLADHRHGGEIEVIERLAAGQAGFGEMAFEAPAIAFGDFDFGESRQEARGGPSLAIGCRGEIGPGESDGWQAQLAEKELHARCVDRHGLGAHAASPATIVLKAS